jgi:hypothetical protein
MPNDNPPVAKPEAKVEDAKGAADFDIDNDMTIEIEENERFEASSGLWGATRLESDPLRYYL